VRGECSPAELRAQVLPNVCRFTGVITGARGTAPVQHVSLAELDRIAVDDRLVAQTGHASCQSLAAQPYVRGHCRTPSDEKKHEKRFHLKCPRLGSNLRPPPCHGGALPLSYESHCTTPATRLTIEWTRWESNPRARSVERRSTTSVSATRGEAKLPPVLSFLSPGRFPAWVPSSCGLASSLLELLAGDVPLPFLGGGPESLGSHRRDHPGRKLNVVVGFCFSWSAFNVDPTDHGSRPSPSTSCRDQVAPDLLTAVESEGIEPSSSECRSDILPLDYDPMCLPSVPTRAPRLFRPVLSPD
jgi:hypothetical protein